MTAAAESTGKVSRTSTLTISMFQVKIGIRNIVMPGARIDTMVVMKFTAERIPEAPTRATPAIHRSPPTPGERMPSDRGV